MRPLAPILLCPFLITACSSPLDGPDHGPFLDKGLTRIIEQEMQSVETLAREATADSPADIETMLANRRDELDALTPVPPGADLQARLGPDLSGEASLRQPIDLDQAVRSAVINNLDLQSARLQPAIKKEEVIQASAVFDIVLGAGVSFGRSRTPTTVVETTGDQPLNVGLSRIEQLQYDVGLSKKLTTGGEVTLSTSMDRQLQRDYDNLKFNPNPGGSADIRFESRTTDPPGIRRSRESRRCVHRQKTRGIGDRGSSKPVDHDHHGNRDRLLESRDGLAESGDTAVARGGG